MKLPDYTALGQSPVATPDRNIVPATLRPVEPVAAGEGMVSLGRAEEGFAADLIHEQNRMDIMRVEDAWTQLRLKQADLTYGPQGFTQLRGKDAVNAPLLKTYGDQLMKASAAIGSGFDNENQRTLFAQRAGISNLQMKEDILKHVDGQKHVYAEDTLKGTIDGERFNAAQRYSQPDAELLPLQRTNAAIEQFARDYGKPAEWVAEMKQKAKDGIYGDMIKTQNVEDPDLAHAMLANHWNDISGNERANLDAHVVNHQYMLAMRDFHKQQREEAMALRLQAREQNARWGDMMGRILSPTQDRPAPPASEIADAVRLQQIAPHMAISLNTLSKEGEENAMDKVRAIQMIHDPNLNIQEKNSRLSTLIMGRKINGTTAAMLQTAIYEIDQKGETAEQRGIFDSMSAIMGGHNVDMGLIHLDNSQERLQAELWGQAREEWTRRVVVGKEDPTAVRNNILQRFSQNTMVPSWLQQPRYGAISNVTDIQNVIDKTSQMWKTGAISDEEASRQNDLLQQYLRFFKDQMSRQKAIDQLTKGGKKEEDTAKVRGVRANP